MLQSYKSWNSGSRSPATVLCIHVYVVTVSQCFFVFLLAMHADVFSVSVDDFVFGGEREKFDGAANIHHYADMNRAGAASVVFNVSEEEL